MLGMLVVAGMILSALAAPVDSAAASAPTEKITLDIKTINGSGCPAGTTMVTANSDNTGFKVEYHRYRAEAGGGATAAAAPAQLPAGRCQRTRSPARFPGHGTRPTRRPHRSSPRAMNGAS